MGSLLTEEDQCSEPLTNQPVCRKVRSARLRTFLRICTFLIMNVYLAMYNRAKLSPLLSLIPRVLKPSTA